LFSGLLSHQGDCLLLLHLLLHLLLLLRWRLLTPVDTKINTLDFWRIYNKDFPTISLFMKSNGAFQPTSLASERLFNKDKMLFGTTRTRFEENRAEGFVFLGDYLNRRVGKAKYVVCKGCPQPPHEEARYRVSCPTHNQ